MIDDPNKAPDEHEMHLFENAAEEGNNGTMLAPMQGSGNPRFVPFTTVMDSGASDHVLNSSVVPEIPIVPSVGAKNADRIGHQQEVHQSTTRVNNYCH